MKQKSDLDADQGILELIQMYFCQIFCESTDLNASNCTTIYLIGHNTPQSTYPNEPCVQM